MDMSDKKFWGDKPYFSLDHYLKQTFGEKVYRLSLNGGMTCPNRDGTLDSRGCIFCSAGGSGDFATAPSLSVTEQITQAKERIRRKSNCRKFIAYFQAYTNTYAPVDYLRPLFLEAIRDPEVVALSIATRPDCLGDDVLQLLDEPNHIKPVWVELGLQTMHESSARFIRRGYPLSCFEQAVPALRSIGIEVITHVILGLPGESQEQMLETCRYLNTLDIQGIKLQLLHVLKRTDLGLLYEAKPFPVMTMEEYISLLIRCIEQLPPQLVIHRLTGDGPKDLLIAPLWSTRKRTVLNQIHAEFRRRGTWQGKYYLPPTEGGKPGGNLCRNHLHSTN